MSENNKLSNEMKARYFYYIGNQYIGNNEEWFNVHNSFLHWITTAVSSEEFKKISDDLFEFDKKYGIRKSTKNT